jgi:hypothetical protein
VADNENRSRVVAEQLLQEIERLDVEVVGRFVENHQIGRPREGSREHQPPALAA